MQTTTKYVFLFMFFVLILHLYIEITAQLNTQDTSLISTISPKSSTPKRTLNYILILILNLIRVRHWHRERKHEQYCKYCFLMYTIIHLHIPDYRLGLSDCQNTIYSSFMKKVSFCFSEEIILN